MKAWQLSELEKKIIASWKGGQGLVSVIHTCNIHSGFEFSWGFLGFMKVFLAR